MIRNVHSLLPTLVNLTGAGVVFLGWWPTPGYFLLEPVLFCGIAILCLLMLQITELRIKRRSLLAYVAFAAWVLLSDSISGELLPALARDVHWLILPLLVVLLVSFFARSEEMLRVLQVAAALSLIVICYRLIDSADGVFDWVHPPIFGNVRRLAMTVGLMSVFLYRDTEHQEKRLLTLARIIGLGLLFWSGSRGAILAWALALLTFTWHAGQWTKLRAWSLEAVVAMLLAVLFDVGNPSMGILTGIFYRSFNAAISGGGVDAISSGRVTLWLKTLDALQDPHVAFLGAGGNGFVRLHLWYRQIFHPHNIVLQVLTDWGIGGLFLLLWLVREWIPKILSAAGKGGTTSVGLALMVFLLITGLLDGGLYHLQYLFFASIAFALVAAGAVDDVSTNRFAVPHFGIVALLLAAMLLQWALKDYRADWPMTPLYQPYVAPSRD